MWANRQWLEPVGLAPGSRRAGCGAGEGAAGSSWEGGEA
jgi:hypothetical protein